MHLVVRGRLQGAWRRDDALAHNGPAIHLLHTPTGQIVECRRTKRLAAAEVELRVVHRATQRVAGEQPVGQRRVVVRAKATDGKQAPFRVY